MAQTSMDAIQLLMDDHQKVSSLFQQAQGGGNMQQLFPQIQQELQIHTSIEEEIFYPACQQQMGDLIREAKQEHDKVDQILQRMSSAEGGQMVSMLQQLKQNVEHHVQEEESELFPKARQTLGQDRIRQLGDQMMERKQQLMQERRAA